MSSEKEFPNSVSEKDPDEFREQFADAFNQPTDPLAEYSDDFEGLPDPFEYYLVRVVQHRDGIDKEGTIEDYERTYRQWRQFMSETGRHPACPRLRHIKSFIDWRREVHNNAPSTIKIKFGRLKQAYQHWQRESVFPHPTDYNLFEIAHEEASFGEQASKQFPDLSVEELRTEFGQISNIRSRALVGVQLKQGLRSSELANAQIQDLHLSHSAVQECYPELGTHPALADYTDVLYVPPDREGNKSEVPRLIPVDEELRWLLIQHLLTKPQVEKPWLFLSTGKFGQLSHNAVNKPWKDAFQPQYAGTEQTRGITSHFGRHWFSSYLRLEAGFNREHVQYMRGDRIEPIDEFTSAIDDYLHPNYEHIETDYRDKIFKLDLSMTHSIP